MSGRRDRLGRRPTRAAVTAALACVALLGVAGCSSSAYSATPLPRSTASPSTSSPPSSTPADPASCLRTFSPLAAVPKPGKGSGATLAAIYKRGYLRAGVSADTRLLGALNPATNTIQGFDVEMLRAVSQALFGSPNKVDLTVITAGQRIPDLQDGTVDIVARAMTVTCERWKQVAFSSVYYVAGQKLLVATKSPIKSTADLRGRRVCATSPSTSLDTIKGVPGVVPVGADTNTACLVLFQQGAVDAITGDDAILAGLAAQDPYAKVVGSSFAQEPYGLAMSSKSTDLVRFVNAVLAQIKRDGTWTKDYDTWLKASLGPAPKPPAPLYGRAAP